MMPAMIIAAARKKVIDRKLLPSCELLPLKNDPEGVCAETDATPKSISKTAATGPFKLLRVIDNASKRRPIRTALDCSNAGKSFHSIEVFICPYSLVMFLCCALPSCLVIYSGALLVCAVPFQLPCHVLGPRVAHATRIMIQNLIRSIVCVCVLAVTAMAQERDESLIRRARSFEPFIIESAQRYGIDARLLWSVCFAESRFRVDVVSPKGARGPMQFMSDTAVRYELANPHDAKSAIDAGARYLRDLLQRFNGRVDLPLAAYNAGEGTVESFLTGRPLLLRTGKIINPRAVITGGIPPYIETQNYVRSILKLSFGSTSLFRRTSDQSRTRSARRKNSEEKVSRRASESSFIEVEP